MFGTDALLCKLVKQRTMAKFLTQQQDHEINGRLTSDVVAPTNMPRVSSIILNDVGVRRMATADPEKLMTSTSTYSCGCRWSKDGEISIHVQLDKT